MFINVIYGYLYVIVIRIKLRHQHEKLVTFKICTPLFTKSIIRCSLDMLHLAAILMPTVAIQLSFETSGKRQLLLLKSLIFTHYSTNMALQTNFSQVFPFSRLF